MIYTEIKPAMLFCSIAKSTRLLRMSFNWLREAQVSILNCSEFAKEDSACHRTPATDHTLKAYRPARYVPRYAPGFAVAWRLPQTARLFA
jgi:hypothetical protein